MPVIHLIIQIRVVNMEKATTLLKDHQLRKTKVRVQVLEVFLNKKEALSSNVIEQEFDKIDRITLYRTLRTFEQKGLIHKAIDGSDKLKYALCHSGCDTKHHHDNHAHFHCEGCGKTICLDDIEAPNVKVPKGYKLDTTHLVLEGICEKCS